MDNQQGDSTHASGLHHVMREKSLKTAGYAYLVGDAALFASGMMSGRHKEAGAGLLWATGGLASARYGNPTAEKRLELLSHKLGAYLRKEGVVIPDAPDTRGLTHQDGLIEKVEAFLYTHPSQALNAAFAVGGTLLTASGIRHHKGWDTASGALVTAGALAGLLIPEKQPDPEHPAVGAFARAKEWVQEKPLRLSGGLYALNNVTLITSAFKESQANPAQKSYLFKYLTAASYIFANGMLSISSKHHANGSEAEKAALEKLTDVSARVIAAQPPQLQDALLENISGFLAAEHGTHVKASDISALLHQKLDAVVAQVQESGKGRTP